MKKLEGFNKGAAKELSKIIKTKELQGIRGYDIVMRQLSSGSEAAFSTRQTLLQVKKIKKTEGIPEENIRFEVPKKEVPRVDGGESENVDVDLATYNADGMEKAYALKSILGGNFQNNCNNAIGQLRMVDKSIQKIVVIEAREKSIAELRTIKKSAPWNKSMEKLQEMRDSGHEITLEIIDREGVVEIIENFQDYIIKN